ncbi:MULTISPECIES: hypothetical protein [unclassified Methylobacterium]|uniref:hypothetical protein n=1 Tax=unclassified Methylobacterium TaxID=2615210 RepID=UPI0036F99885
MLNGNTAHGPYECPVGSRAARRDILGQGAGSPAPACMVVISSHSGEITAFDPVAGCAGSMGSGCLNGLSCAVGAGLLESHTLEVIARGDLDHQFVPWRKSFATRRSRTVPAKLVI